MAGAADAPGSGARGALGGAATDGGAATRSEPVFEPLPGHVAVIMDGNRRWARERQLPEAEGHAAGVEAVRRILSHSVRRGIGMLSLYAFSRENWARSDDEVAWLLSLLESAIRSETPELIAQGVEVRLLGRINELPPVTRESILEAIDATSGGVRMRLNIAFNYAGRTEIVDAVRAIVRSGVPAEAVDEELIGVHLYTAGMPDPDLVIRTGGEQRLSNFLIWQTAYAEFFSSPTLWPDFGPEALDDALSEYARRSRRFGR
ncbi:MAG: polyprenyl diphosphate synthase [Chloroflexota bacterium]